MTRTDTPDSCRLCTGTDLNALLGHDARGHRTANALLRGGITTEAALREHAVTRGFHGWEGFGPETARHILDALGLDESAVPAEDPASREYARLTALLLDAGLTPQVAARRINDYRREVWAELTEALAASARDPRYDAQDQRHLRFVADLLSRADAC